MDGKCKYEEVLALEFFKRAIENYGRKGMDSRFFEPLVRNLDDDSAIFDIRDELLPAPGKDASPKELGDYDAWRKQCEDDTAEETCNCIWQCSPAIRRKLRAKLAALTGKLLASMRERAAGDPLPERIKELKATLHLDDKEVDLTLVLWLLDSDRLPFFHYAGSCRGEGIYTGMSEQSVFAALRASSRLCRYGVVPKGKHGVASKIKDFLSGIETEPLTSSFYRKDAGDVLPMDFFGDLAKKHLPVLKKLIGDRRGSGINILLYGAPGTGKTSFARALAAETGRTCYQIEQRPKNRDGDYTSAKSEIRYAAIEICNEQIVHEDSLVVVDEADALLQCVNTGFPAMANVSNSLTGDKGLLNDILEKGRAPTVWIANTAAEDLNLSNRRRFDYSIRFDPLTKAQRIGVWKNAAAKAGMSEKLTGEDIVRLVERYPVNTGIAARAFANAARAGGTREECLGMVEALLDRQCELSGVEDKAAETPAVSGDYSLEGLNIKSKIPLEKVLCAARRFLDAGKRGCDRDAPRMNILLSGAPGTGKTEFVKYFASSMGKPLCTRRPSDLKSMWVGKTEQNIADAFRDARERGAVLFFDEIDSFLDNRKSLSQSHEKSMVNEVLQQMEGFGGIFVGTTNFAEMLDPAVARRFTFKIELDYLTSSGKRSFFKRFFGTELSPVEESALDGIECLTPGDFRTVRQEFYYLGDEVDNAERIAALGEEVRARSAGRRGRVGF